MRSKPYDRTGSKNPKWKGGVYYRKDGRVFVYAPDHPNCINGKYVLRYRLVMEAHLGRLLSPKEVVHHINGNPSDDRIENLMVLTHKTHHDFHGLPKHKWAHKYGACVVCGENRKDSPGHKHNSHGLCGNCAERKRRHRKAAIHRITSPGRARGSRQGSHKLAEADVSEILRLSKLKLKDMKEMAGMFGVSHTTIQRIVYRQGWLHVPLP